MLASRATQCCAGHCTALDDFHSLDDLQLPVAVKSVSSARACRAVASYMCWYVSVACCIHRSAVLSDSLTHSLSLSPLVHSLSVCLSLCLTLSLCLLSVGWLAGDTYSIFIQ